MTDRNLDMPSKYQLKGFQPKADVNEWGEPIEADGAPFTQVVQEESANEGKRTKSSSFSATVADLKLGECATRTHFLNPKMTLAELARDMAEMKAQILNNARPSVKIARERTGNDYRIETSESITTGGRIYLHVIVTRTV